MTIQLDHSADELTYAVLPGGPLPLAVFTDSDGVVVAAGFRDLDWIAGLLDQRPDAVPGDVGESAALWEAYLDGDLRALDRVRVRQSGSPVQAAVWDALRLVPPGEPVSYGEMAEIIGRPRAARAVGSACASNRIAPFIPCHRVVAAGGGLGGYGYGVSVKRWLLDHEQRS
jgi:methylated-DNA-[protein]-cysteine S-methyltransferase